MADDNNLKVALAIQNIALAVDDQTLKKISDNLSIIEMGYNNLMKTLDTVEHFVDMADELQDNTDLTFTDKEKAKISAYECIKRRIKGTKGTD